MPPELVAQLKGTRREWLNQVEALTKLVREQRARRLELRGAALAEERLRAWQRGEELEPEQAHALERDLVYLAERASSLEEREALLETARAVAANVGARSFATARSDTGRPQRVPPMTTQWHSARARGKRTLFERVETCADDKRVLHLSCRDCGWKPDKPIPIGCCAQHFCPQCKARQAQKFRVDFQRKQLGLEQVTRQAGLMNRYRRRTEGGRFGERLLTLTAPHVGSPVERVEVLRAAFPRFWRLLSDHLRPRLASLASGIKKVDAERYSPRTGELREFKAKRRVRATKVPEDELSLWDLVAYLWVFEWTPGDDLLGHPHIHMWLFSPFIEQELLERLWCQALCDVGPFRREGCDEKGRPLICADNEPASEARRVIVDVRRAYEIQRDGSTVANELVKYLTKDWEVSEDGVKRAPPEVFSQVWTAIDGQRGRQSSAGLARFAIEKFACCPCCNYENERGHWAHVRVVENLPAWLRVCAQGEQSATGPPATAPPDDVPSRESELRREYWEQRDADWRESFELRILQARWSKGVRWTEAELRHGRARSRYREGAA